MRMEACLIRTASFVAAPAQVFWALLIAAPQLFGISGKLDWAGVLMVLESIVLLLFFLVMIWQHEGVNRRSQLGYVALIAV